MITDEGIGTHPHIKKLVFIGYSGGGTLAVLLAPYFDNIKAVITIAANLDTDSWTTLHHYTPLSHSLNPIQQPPLSASIKQIHIAGKNDNNIPVKLIQSYIDKQYHAQLIIIKKQAHSHWQPHWLKILDII